MVRRKLRATAPIIAALILTLSVASPPSATPSETTTARGRLLGSWTQVSDEELLPNGSIMRADEIGLVMYDDSGHMSEQVMRQSAPRRAIPSDAKYLVDGYDASRT